MPLRRDFLLFLPLSNSFSLFTLTQNKGKRNRLLHGGGGLISGGSMSNLLKEENKMVMTMDESSIYPDDSGLELGLGLGLGVGVTGKVKNKPAMAAAGGGYWDQYARILTAKDFDSVVSNEVSSSSSSSSVTKADNNSGSCGTKRTAESPSSPPGRPAISCHVVGWPPVRTYRMNSLANHAKPPATEDFISTVDKCKSINVAVDQLNHGRSSNTNVAKEKELLKTSSFIKVTVDGIPIGRKVDLNAHSSYVALAHSLDDMFRPGRSAGSNMEEQVAASGARQALRLLDGSSDFVITYEDKDGDWMLVGDVPWDMFLNSVRRLRIMRAAEANGLAPLSSERNRRW